MAEPKRDAIQSSQGPASEEAEAYLESDGIMTMTVAAVSYPDAEARVSISDASTKASAGVPTYGDRDAAMVMLDRKCYDASGVAAANPDASCSATEIDW